MTNGTNNSKSEFEPITKITVAGYKSIREEQSIEIAPLTLLAGANSSGKSSIMQPLLLLKQTLEATYDPGALKIDGPIVKFTRISQLFFEGQGFQERRFSIALGIDDVEFKADFEARRLSAIEIIGNAWQQNNSVVTIVPGMNPNEINQSLLSLAKNPFLNELFLSIVRIQTNIINKHANAELSIFRDRFFLDVASISLMSAQKQKVSEPVEAIIYIPGLRGNPARDYGIGSVGRTYPGTFENYTASIIAKWQQDNPSNLQTLGKWLRELGLTSKVEAMPIDDTRVELRVAFSRRTVPIDRLGMVNIADVGFGVSQVLPVLVALLAARPGQLVYIEQPELHLHPRAQVAMAKILAEAAQRGVRVVAETHSSLLLTGVQTLVAEGSLEREKVKLHWFTRDEDSGETTIQSADLDETGAFGDWPEDFDDVILETEGRYLNAAELRLAQRKQREHSADTGD
jgi:predicted ATPase